MIYERKRIMKKNAVKLIALSMLPLSLMSFKPMTPMSLKGGPILKENISQQKSNRTNFGSYSYSSDLYNQDLYATYTVFQPTQDNDFNTVYLYVPLFSALYNDENFAEPYQSFLLDFYKLKQVPPDGVSFEEKGELLLANHDERNQDMPFWNIPKESSKYVSFYGTPGADSSLSQSSVLRVDLTAYYKDVLGFEYFDVKNPDYQEFNVRFSGPPPLRHEQTRFVIDEEGKIVDYKSLPVPYFEGEYHISSGGKKDVYVNIDNPISLDQIKSGIKGKDLFGSDVPLTYSVKKESSEYNPLRLGTYSYDVIGTAYGQTATATLNIIVKDITAPAISNPTQVSIPYSQGLKISDLESKFTASDNATNKGGTIGEIMYFVGDTQIDKDHPYTFTAEQIKANKINITVKVHDSSGNEAVADFEVLLIDDKAPEILTNGKPVEEGARFKTALNTFSNAESAKQAFLAGFTALDEYDPFNPVVEIVNFPNLDNVRIGDNEVTLSAVDEAGNRKNLKVIVEVTNDQLPVFIFDDFLISATVENPLTADQLSTLISDYLYETTNTVVSNEDIRVASSFYEENAKRPGKYTVAYNYKQANGTYSDSKSVDILVSGGDQIPWWDLLVKNISDFFQRLGNWFMGKGFKTNAEIHDEEILSQGKEE